MELKPGEIIGSLSKEDQELLNDVLSVEKRRLHITEIKANSRDEKEIVSEIVKIIDKAISDDN